MSSDRIKEAPGPSERQGKDSPPQGDRRERGSLDGGGRDSGGSESVDRGTSLPDRSDRSGGSDGSGGGMDGGGGGRSAPADKAGAAPDRMIYTNTTEEIKAELEKARKKDAAENEAKLQAMARRRTG